MKGTVLYGPRDVRFEERDAPTIINPTDAIVRISATCVCGSDLWPYRGISSFPEPSPMGHEYCGIVEEVGSAVTSVKPGQFVIGSFATSDNTCPHCRAGYQSSCIHREFITRAQAPMLRVPLADGTLVPTPGMPSDDLIPSLLTISDVFGTGWFAADAANVKPGMTVAVVGDGAVGLLAVLSAKQMGAKRIIAMSRHEARQKLAREFGATDIVTERGEDGAARINELTDGIGADAVRRHARVDDAGDPFDPPGRERGLRRRPVRSKARLHFPWGSRGAVLQSCPSPWRPRAGAPLPARTDRPGVEQEDQPRQGLRPDLASRGGGGGLPRDGRTACDQDAAAPVD
jgi:D-arabinose 1-dehydrogenase-like Zn-dependent alcohol dehydrogenase